MQLGLFEMPVEVPLSFTLGFVSAAGTPTNHAMFAGSWRADRQEVAYLRAMGRWYGEEA